MRVSFGFGLKMRLGAVSAGRRWLDLPGSCTIQQRRQTGEKTEPDGRFGARFMGFRRECIRFSGSSHSPDSRLDYPRPQSSISSLSRQALARRILQERGGCSSTARVIPVVRLHEDQPASADQHLLCKFSTSSANPVNRSIRQIPFVRPNANEMLRAKEARFSAETGALLPATETERCSARWPAAST